MGDIKTIADKVWKTGPVPGNERVRQVTDEIDTLVEAKQDSGAVFQLASHTVGNIPAAGTEARLIYVSDGDSGSPCLAVDNGTNWLRVSLGAEIFTTSFSGAGSISTVARLSATMAASATGSLTTSAAVS